MAEAWRKLHSEELHDLYSSPSIIRMVNKMMITYALLVRKPEEKKTTREIKM
jgi:hypothetical protein